MASNYATKGVGDTKDICYRWNNRGTCDYYVTHGVRCKYKHPASYARDPNDPLIDDRPGSHFQNFNAAPPQAPPQGGFNGPVEYYQGGNEWGFYGNEPQQNFQPPPQQDWGGPPPQDQFWQHEMNFQPQGVYTERPLTPAQQGYDPLRDGYDPVLMAANSAPPPTTFGLQPALPPHQPQQPPIPFIPPPVDPPMQSAYTMAPPTLYAPPIVAFPPPPPPPPPPAPLPATVQRGVQSVGAPLAASKAVKIATKLTVPPNPQCPTWQATKTCSQSNTTCPHFHAGKDCPSFYCNHTCPSGSSCKMAHRSYHELVAREIERNEREAARAAEKAKVEHVAKKAKVDMAVARSTTPTPTPTTTQPATTKPAPPPTPPTTQRPIPTAPTTPALTQQPQPQKPTEELNIEEQPFGGILMQFSSMRCARELQSTVLALDTHLHPEVGQDFISMAVEEDRTPPINPPTMGPIQGQRREDTLRVRCAPATLVNLISSAPDQEHLQRAIHLFLA